MFPPIIPPPSPPSTHLQHGGPDGGPDVRQGEGVAQAGVGSPVRLGVAGWQGGRVSVRRVRTMGEWGVS